MEPQEALEKIIELLGDHTIEVGEETAKYWDQTALGWTYEWMLPTMNSAEIIALKATFEIGKIRLELVSMVIVA